MRVVLFPVPSITRKHALLSMSSESNVKQHKRGAELAVHHPGALEILKGQGNIVALIRISKTLKEEKQEEGSKQ
jgi:hypothetical protein